MSVDLKKLEDHLATRSYVEGYAPSQADVHVFKTLGSAPAASQYPHSSRWYKHIASWSSEHVSLPGSSNAGKTFCGAADAAKEEEEEEDVDLFGSDDEEDEEAERLKAERLKAYNEKKSQKPKVAAKSVVTLQVKPWDDQTDMVELEKGVRAIEKEGLLWGASTLVAIGYGIKMLQINLVVEDELVSLEELEEEIRELEDYVQSTDVAAMQKL